MFLGESDSQRKTTHVMYDEESDFYISSQQRYRIFNMKGHQQQPQQENGK